jgi:hypothetical protein
VFVAFAIQHEKRMRLIMMSFVTYLADPHLSILSHKGYDVNGTIFGKKLLNIKRAF